MSFCSANIFRKSHENALLELWRFQSYDDENDPRSNLPPISNTTFKHSVVELLQEEESV